MDLPDDKIYEICESLDNKSLARFMQTSQRIYRLCDSLLVRRKEQSRLDLIDNLVGRWFISYIINSTVRLTSIRIDVKDNELIVYQPEPSKSFSQFILPGSVFNPKSKMYQIRIDLDDYLNLKKLHKHLIDTGYTFIRSTDKIWGWDSHRFNVRINGIFTSCGHYSYLLALIQFAYILGIPAPDVQINIDPNELSNKVRQIFIYPNPEILDMSLLEDEDFLRYTLKWGFSNISKGDICSLIYNKLEKENKIVHPILLQDS